MLDRKEILEKIKADGLYETIADYYYLISKDDLVTILKELDFAIYQYSYKKNIYDKIVKDCIESLTDEWMEQ
jgi:hypothetical protein